uniref:Insulin-like receptor n=1 Tax=Anthurium amnicola TaxID=1678845 RepID=A0A1D1YIE9_9ARAE
MPSHTSLCLLLAVALCAVAVIGADDAPGGDAGGGDACMGVDVGDDVGDQRPRLKNACSACTAIHDCCDLLRPKQCSGVQQLLALQGCNRNKIVTISTTCQLCTRCPELCSSASDME